MALGFLPLGLAAVLLTASREGFVAAVLGLAGSAILLMWGQARRLAACLIALPPLVAAFWFLIPSATLERLATIPEQLHGGDLNQRVNIWSEGWKAFTHAPLVGSGAGTFVAAAHLAPIDTAHNTALSLVVTGGLCALMLAFVLVALAARAALATRGAMRLMLVTSLVVWASTALVATVEENRTTWLLFAIVILAARMYSDDPEGMGRCFASGSYEAPTCPPVILVVEA
jgi:O-antigen ligase